MKRSLVLLITLVAVAVARPAAAKPSVAILGLTAQRAWESKPQWPIQTRVNFVRECLRSAAMNEW